MDFRKKYSQIYGFLRKLGFYVSKKRILTICTPSDPNSRRRQDPILRFPPFPLKTPFRKILIAKFYETFAEFLRYFSRNSISCYVSAELPTKSTAKQQDKLMGDSIHNLAIGH